MNFFIKQLSLVCFLALSFSGMAQNNLVFTSNSSAILEEEICLDIHFLSFDEEGVGDYEITWNPQIGRLVNATAKQEDFFSNFTLAKDLNLGMLQFSITPEMLESIRTGSLNPAVCILPFALGNTEISIKKISDSKITLISKEQLNVYKSYVVGEKLIASMEIANPDACVEISVEGFTTINRLTFSVNNPGVGFVFREAINFNAALGIAAADVTTNPFGEIIVIWDAPNQTTGVTVPDGTVILELCYDITAPPGTVGMIAFNGTGAISVFQNIDGSSEVPQKVEGSITIPNVAPLEIQDDFVSPDNCFDVDNGEVTITPNGGMPPYTYMWSNTTTNKDLLNVPGGTYSVTVSDSSTPLNQIVSSYTVPADTISPTADTGPMQSITCDDDIITLGGNNTSIGAEFEYQWQGPPGVMFVSGINDPMAEVDTPGQYSLRVINGVNGCTTETFVLVEDETTPPNLMLPEDQPLTCDAGGLVLEAMNDEGLNNLSADWTATSGGIIDDANDLSISISTPGTYEVVLTNDDTGCSSMNSVTIDPQVLPTLSLVGDPDLLNCDQNTIELVATFDPANSIIWTTSGGVIDSGENTETVVVSSAGIYIAEVTDALTSCTNSIEVTVEGDTSEPTVMAGDDKTITCDVTVVTLNGSTDTEDGSIAWTDEGGNFAGNQLILDVNRPGLYNLNITNAFGCMRSAQVEVIADTISPIANAGVDMEVGCIGADINLDGSGSSMGSEFTYMWSTLNGVLVSGFNTLTPAISSAGVYDLIVTNTENGCSALSNVEISIQGNLPVADAGEGFSTCEDQVTLMGNIEAGLTGVWTTMTSANIDNPNSATISVSNLSPGPNEFRWTLSTEDCADFSTGVVIVILESTPNANNDIFSVPLDSTMISSNVIFNDDLTSDDVTIDFSSIDSNFIDLGDGSFSYVFPSDSVQMATFDYLICSAVCPTLCDSATLTLAREEPMIEPVELDGLPNGITPNGDGLNDALVFDILLTNPQDFPNPEFIVFNRWGDVVYKQQPYDNNWQGTSQDGKELPEGTYYFINRLNLEETEILSGDITIIRD